MEELNDKDFDQIFKNKITTNYLEYEEESWIKMEKKLRKRDRFVFYRNASIILLFLSFGIGLYLTNDYKLQNSPINAGKKITQDSLEKAAPSLANNQRLKEIGLEPTRSNGKQLFTNKPLITENHQANQSTVNSVVEQPIVANNTPTAVQNQTPIQNNPIISIQEPATSAVKENIPIISTKTKFPISIAFIIGPDFNSTENTIGGKSGMAIGLGVSIGLSKKLSVQTGVNYGSKNYDAGAYDYTFNNPSVVNTIAGIDASCKVLEIPLRASYALIDNQKSSISLNAGLSSYLMLKENYRFIYTAASGRKDRFLEEKNANQHYLSVIDLSATYNIKLKNKKFALGLEPYIKIPLGGIGEGNVPLKSSGISLKLNYELNKK